MADADTGLSKAALGKGPMFVGSAFLALAIAVGVGIFFAVQFVDEERSRNLQAWQIRLGIVADSRAAAVENWAESKISSVWDLAENASLQLYLTELADGGDIEGDLAPEAAFLRSLLGATALRAGFTSPQASQVKANVEAFGVGGLALTGPKGRFIVATPGMAPSIPGIAQAMSDAAQGRLGLVDLYSGVGDTLGIAFVVPVYSVQGQSGTGQQIGFVVGALPVGRDLFDRLRQPGEVSESAETYLVRISNSSVEYISPLADGTPPLRRKLILDTPELAAAMAIKKSGGFGILRDYGGAEVLAVSRALTKLPWVLVRKISSQEVLEEAESRYQTILIVLVLSIVGVAVTIIAAWRHGSSVKAMHANEQLAVSVERAENLALFMRKLADAQPSEVIAVTGDGAYTFANRMAAELHGVEQDEMLGKTMTNVIGPVRTSLYTETNREVLQSFESVEKVYTFDGEDDSKQVIRANHVPLSGDRDHPDGVLMVLHDITGIVQERQKRERSLRQLVNTLVTLVDQRDSYSATHAANVAELSAEIAGEMGLPEEVSRTVDLVGNLINVGKIFVPAEILMKTERLTDEERHLVNDCLLASADLLDGVEFEVPVVDTLRQVRERWDGTGAPNGLSGDQISVGARVVSVANAYVGMICPRAHRNPIPFEKVCRILIDDSGTVFDPGPVMALLNFVENRENGKSWRDPEFIAAGHTPSTVARTFDDLLKRFRGTQPDAEPLA